MRGYFDRGATVTWRRRATWPASRPWGFAIPSDPALDGAVVYAQSVVLDPLDAFAGLAFTSGLVLTIGI